MRVSMFSSTLSSTILSISSVQKFQQPKYIIHENKIKSHRRCMSQKKTTRYTIKIYTMPSLLTNTPCCVTNPYTFCQIYIFAQRIRYTRFFCLFFDQSIHFIHKQPHISSSNTWISHELEHH